MNGLAHLEYSIIKISTMNNNNNNKTDKDNICKIIQAKTSNCDWKDHSDITKVTDPVVKDLISNKLYNK